MVQKFFDVPTDGNDYICDTQHCNVGTFACGVGGVCPGCDEIGKPIATQGYPETPPSGGPEETQKRIDMYGGCGEREEFSSSIALCGGPRSSQRICHNYGKEAGQSGLESGICAFWSDDRKIRAVRDAYHRFLEQYPQI